MNRTSEFFQEIEHPEVPWRTYQLHVPVFYFDTMLISVSFLAATERVKSILPSKPRFDTWPKVIHDTAFEGRR